MKIWYAWMQDGNDSDWGDGTFDKQLAIRVLKNMLESGDYPEAYIAAINTDTSTCLYEMRECDLQADI